ncbi:hypothetical protein L1987_78029 [Smallanthus sonchifolius]|uniref:Uncharacterized protein n=1 Tax=Smallanthus sonchifolius TaxID=185202 RepID=A0ACB8ZC12_9ASTR|nr:hypothetical protein L1987_78029 [Smallanthus sonchifolius]
MTLPLKLIRKTHYLKNLVFNSVWEWTFNFGSINPFNYPFKYIVCQRWERALEKITEGSVRSSISEQQQPLPSFAYCLRAATVGSATGRPLPPPLSRLRSHKEIAAGSDDLTKKLQSDNESTKAMEFKNVPQPKQQLEGLVSLTFFRVLRMYALLGVKSARTLLCGGGSFIWVLLQIRMLILDLM